MGKERSLCMDKRNLIIAITALFLLTLGSGCARKVVVYEKPAPPAPKTEIRPASPYHGAVWVPGHWEWRNRRRGYVWVPGHWR